MSPGIVLNECQALPRCAVLFRFNCPDDPQNAGNRCPNLTSYLAVVGPHTAWSGATPRKLSDFKNPSKTILLVEVANSGIHWAEPRDLYVGSNGGRHINPKVGQGVSSRHPRRRQWYSSPIGSIHSLPSTDRSQETHRVSSISTAARTD